MTREKRRRPFFSSKKAWLGEATVFFTIAIAYSLAILFLG